MKTENDLRKGNDGFEIIHLLSGQFLVSSNSDTVFSTVLGSCICACIYDPVAAIGGMNHFVLPNGGEQAPPIQRYRYGDAAMPALVASLCRRGAQHDRLIAKLYGGRLRNDSGRDPGALNTEFAKHFLRSNGIKLIEASVGENVARWITFQPTTGKTTVRETEDSAVFTRPKHNPVSRRQPHR